MRKRKISALTVLAVVFLTSLPTCRMAAAAAEELEILPQEINYWSMWEEDEKQAEVIQKAADAYEESTGIHVAIQWKGREIKNLLQPALDAGETIDLFDDDYQRVIQQDRTYVCDLSELGSTVEYENHIVPAFLEQMKKWGDGKVYALPYQPYVAGVWYNKDLWEEVGLTEEDVPASWTELLAVCETIKNSETGLDAMTCGEDTVKLLYGAQLADYLDQEAILQLVNSCTWDHSIEVKRAAEDIQILFSKGYMSESAPAPEKEGQNEIGDGKTVMELQGSWMPGEVMTDTGAENEWGFFPWPTLNGQEQEAAIAGAQGFGIVKNSDMKQEAFDFAYLISTGEYDLELAQYVNSIPADTDNVQWPELIMSARDAFLCLKTPYMWAAGLEANEEYSDRIQENLLRMVRQELTAGEFAQEMEKMKG